MGYTPISFTAGEQPTTSKWNILGTNDASFADGTGIANLATNVTAISNPYKFRARPTSDQTGVGAAYTTVTLGTEDFDTNSNFASSTYTVPVSGFYQINASIAFSSTAGLYDGGNIRVYKNGATAVMAAGVFDNNWSQDYLCISVSDIIQLTAGDTLVMQGKPELVSSTGGFSTASSFSGYLVSRT